MQTIIGRVKRHEGFSPLPYRDSLGFWTIGYGHRFQRGESIPTTAITKYDAEEILMTDLYQASDRYLRWSRHVCSSLDTTRAGVCVELIFWVGFSGFKKFRKMIAGLHRQDYQRAALELYNSDLGKNYSHRAKTLAVLMWEGKRNDGW